MVSTAKPPGQSLVKPRCLAHSHFRPLLDIWTSYSVPSNFIGTTSGVFKSGDVTTTLLAESTPYFQANFHF